MARKAFGAIKELPSRKFHAQYLHPHEKFTAHGTRNYITAPHTFDRKTSARAWLDGIKADIDRGVWKSPEQEARERHEAELQAERDSYTFADHAKAHMATSNYRTSTRRSMESYLNNHLLPRWGVVPLKEITTQDVTRWIATELSPNHQGARKKAFQLFRAILSDAVDNELIGRNPCIRKHAETVNTVRKSRRHAPRKVTADELAAVLKVLAPSTRLIAQVLAHTGIRVGEVRALRRSDIELETGTIRVRRGVTGDGATLSREPQPKTPAGVRTVQIDNPELLDALARHMAGLPVTGASALVFPSPSNPYKHFSENTIRRNIKRACEKAQVKHFSPHDLRNTFATLAGRAPGVSVRDVQAALGHTTPSMALRYMKSDEEQQTRIAVGVASQLARREQSDTVTSLDARRASNE